MKSSYSYDLLKGGEQRGFDLLAGGEQKMPELLSFAPRRRTEGEQARMEVADSARESHTQRLAA